MERPSTKSRPTAVSPAAAAPHAPAVCGAAGWRTIQPGPVPGVPSELQLAFTARWA